MIEERLIGLLERILEWVDPYPEDGSRSCVYGCDASFDTWAEIEDPRLHAYDCVYREAMQTVALWRKRGQQGNSGMGLSGGELK